IGGEEADARVFQMSPRPPQHALREVEAGNECVAVSPAEDVFRVAAIAAARVENALGPAHLERLGTDNAARGNGAQREDGGGGGELAGEPVVVVLDEAAIFAEGLPLVFFRFQNGPQTSAPPVRTFRIVWESGWHGMATPRRGDCTRATRPRAATPPPPG